MRHKIFILDGEFYINLDTSKLQTFIYKIKLNKNCQKWVYDIKNYIPASVNE